MYKESPVHTGDYSRRIRRLQSPLWTGLNAATMPAKLKRLGL